MNIVTMGYSYWPVNSSPCPSTGLPAEVRLLIALIILGGP